MRGGLKNFEHQFSFGLVITPFSHQKKKMNEWKKSFISSAKLELFLNNTTNSRHLQPQDMHCGAFPHLIILNMMWTNSPRIFLWSIIQLSNGKKYYDRSLITYQKISQNISYPLSHPYVLVAPYQVNGYSMWQSVWILI